MDNYTEKEALEYLVGLGEAKLLQGDNGLQYSTRQLYHVADPIPAKIQATTLTAMVDYIKSNFEKRISEKLIIHVAGPDKVILYSPLRSDAEREAYMECNALLPNNIIFNHFIAPDEFNIMLQSSFVENADRKLLLQVTGCIQDKMIKQVGDDGISQAATIKTGVANVDNVQVPNPVVLAPFRTFPEIEQPESKFIFRMQSGPAAALFEADGGAWRNKAMDEIADYFKTALSDVPSVTVIS